MTLAGADRLSAGWRALLIEDRSVGGFPEWFDSLGQQPILGPLPLAVIIFAVLSVVAVIVLSHRASGATSTSSASNVQVARFSGVRVARVRLTSSPMSGFIAALAGVLLAARLGAVRGSTAEGFELDIITMVLLGGVSIFGGKGTMPGVILSILLILNLRNGLGLANITGNTQTGVVGVLLILSVLHAEPRVVAAARSRFSRERRPVPATNPGMTQVD